MEGSSENCETERHMQLLSSLNANSNLSIAGDYLNMTGEKSLNNGFNGFSGIKDNSQYNHHIYTRRKVLDAVFGHLEFDNYVWNIIDTPQFQRLRNLKQLGNCHFIFPGGTHTRFEHSLGVGHLSNKLVTHLVKPNNESFSPGMVVNDRSDDFYIQAVTLAGLLHDLGHGPFSHLFDRKVIKFLDPSCAWEHENGSAMMLDYLIDDNYIDMEREQIKLIQNLILGEHIMSNNSDSSHADWIFQIVSNKKNSIDVDKFDYLCRDSFHIGLNSSSVDYHRIFDSSRIIGGNLCFNIKNHFNLLSLFQHRYKLFKDVYLHKKNIAIDLMVKDILILANPYFDFLRAIHDPEEYIKLDDSVLDVIQNFSSDSECDDPQLLKASQMVTDLRYRKFYKYINQILITEENEHITKNIKIQDIICHNNPKDELYIREEDLDLVSYSIDWGNGDRNPFDHIHFYKNESPNVSFLYPHKNSSLSIPNTFKESYLFLYCKDRSKYERACEMFDSYYKKIKSEFINSKDEYKYSTPTKENKFISQKRYSTQSYQELMKDKNTDLKLNKIN